MKKKALFLLRVTVGILFIVSGFTKLMEPYQNFLAVVYQYKVLTGVSAQVFAVAVPWSEFVLGVFLVGGLWIRPAAAVLWLLNSAFLVAIVSALFRRLPIHDCGCFIGSSVSLSLKKVLFLDIGLWAAFLVLFFFAKNADFASLDRYFQKKLSR